jgi:hypothetical protein
MSSDYDATEFVDGDLQGQKSPYSGVSSGAASAPRAPTREEVDAKVAEAQQKLAGLKRAQEQLERERAALEETRRRQMEFQTGRQEMVQSLTRGLGLLEEAEFASRREAEQMAKSILELRDALTKVESIREETWNREGFDVELTRALTTLENARMEWNAARLKFQVLAGETTKQGSPRTEMPEGALLLGRYSFGEMLRFGFALTWPVALGLLAVLVMLILRR